MDDACIGTIVDHCCFVVDGDGKRFCAGASCETGAQPVADGVGRINISME